MSGAGPAGAGAGRGAVPRAGSSEEVRGEGDGVKRFLVDNLDRHDRVVRMTDKARRIVRGLFQAFLSDPRLLPPDHRREAPDQARAIADYIAGMTDRYAIREHRRLFEMG